MTEPPREAPPKRTGHAPSLVLVNTGDGKGKTTAAMGIVLRAVARGWRVCVVQFVKSGEWRAGEERLAQRLGVEWHAMGEGFTWDSDDLERSAGMAGEAWRVAREKIASGAHDLVVLDEVTYPMNWGWIDVAEIVEAIRARPEHVNVVITGRDAPGAIVEIADTVTEMRKVRHAYDAGIAARRGIDY
jgi:cob(I)alamin adenosyltransferase